MGKVNLENIGQIRLNSYRPICMNLFGLEAIEKYKLPPFIDASCRREPDFENPNPSITALCRQDKFAPHLNVNDIIVYITTQGRYKNEYTKEHHHRLIGILQVIEKKNSHRDAANWYKARNIQIPSNCMIPENPPKIYDKTASLYCRKKDMKAYFSKPSSIREKIGERTVKKWNADYQLKAKKWGDFVITKPIFLELNNPPIVLRNDFQRIFGRFPQTRMPNKISFEELQGLGNIAQIEIEINERKKKTEVNNA